MTNCIHCGDRTIDIQIIDNVVVCNPCIDVANASD